MAVYLIAAIVGGGLMAASLIFGHSHGADGGFDHHVGTVDHGAPTDHTEHDLVGHGAEWLPFLSLRFWTYATGIFGLCGVLLKLFVQTTEPTTAIISIITGVAAGWIVHVLMRLAARAESDTSIKTNDFMGSRGRLLVGCSRGSEGKVRLELKGSTVELLALPYQGDSIPSDTEVVIMTIENDRAMVVPTEQLELLQNA